MAGLDGENLGGRCEVLFGVDRGRSAGVGSRTGVFEDLCETDELNGVPVGELELDIAATEPKIES